MRRIITKFNNLFFVHIPSAGGPCLAGATAGMTTAAVVMAVVVVEEVLAAAGWWSLMTGYVGTPLLLSGGDASLYVLPLNSWRHWDPAGTCCLQRHIQLMPPIIHFPA